MWEKKKVKKVKAQELAAIVGMLCFAARIIPGANVFNYESTVGLFECSVCGSVGPTMGEMGSSRYCVK